jgi:hypothetical protein
MRRIKIVLVGDSASASNLTNQFHTLQTIYVVLASKEYPKSFFPRPPQLFLFFGPASCGPLDAFEGGTPRMNQRRLFFRLGASGGALIKASPVSSLAPTFSHSI